VVGDHVVVAPLTSGSGTKYKILEAMALARPVATTPVGAEGLDLIDGRHAAIAPDLASFADRVAHLLANPRRTEAMGAAAHDHVIANHSLPALEQRLRTAMAGMGLL
jgi:polysaccharide biosynthesis protein PslH